VPYVFESVLARQVGGVVAPIVKDPFVSVNHSDRCVGHRESVETGWRFDDSAHANQSVGTHHSDQH
jgi:hypothetical protein